ncbi:unnamed protein product [Arabidopsis arenosa]|uniref:Uncharacterized protein n=1 Tax=Arabidopsis arenosa TaxID=38785 RepID=A0A8S2ABP8_ARAAE|nr:unnamed protein product [Arabidopsis arenosa]
MARVKVGDREYESGSREGAVKDPTEETLAEELTEIGSGVASDAAPVNVAREASVDATEDSAEGRTTTESEVAIEAPSVPEVSDKEVAPSATEVSDKEVEGVSFPELSYKEEDVSVSDKEEENRECDKEEEVHESNDGQGNDGDEEERISDVVGRETNADNEEDEVTGVIKDIFDDIAAEEEERVNDVAADTDEDDDDDEFQPLPPESMYFGPTEYMLLCRTKLIFFEYFAVIFY